MRHKVFISYHHSNDQWYKDALVEYGQKHGIFVDQSVSTGDIPDHLTAERIQETIPDECLRDSSVTIVFVGTETKGRKHIDWEIYSRMYDGRVSQRSGILVVNLPTIRNMKVISPYGVEEKRLVYLEVTQWRPLPERNELEEYFPYMPSRITGSLVSGVKISVTRWEVLTPDRLRFLFDVAFANLHSCHYNLSASMKECVSLCLTRRSDPFDGSPAISLCSLPKYME